MLEDFFYFQQFSLKNKNAAFKINTDGVLLAAWADVSQVQTVLDIGTGTAVIAHICHFKNPKAKITGIDIDLPSCEEARFNVRHNQYSNYIDIVNADIRYWASPMKYDYIITNPPYFNNSTLPLNPKLRFSKHTSYLSAEELWRCINRFSHTKSKACLIIPTESKDHHVHRAMKAGFSPEKILHVKNRPKGKVRRVIVEFSRMTTTLITSELCIHSVGSRHYSEEFIELHKDLNMIFKK